ncbi:MAG: glycosyltransferase family 39 protein [Rhodopirellula sp.]|nr:glycosyltransferase family 39 protein [Rhodopirellula sp.]
MAATLDPASGTSASFLERHPVRCFLLFALCHATLWTILPVLTQPNAPLDTLEMIYWGHEWQPGYYKHPPLPAWIAEFACLLSTNDVWPTYVLCQLATLGCFWGAFQIGREMRGNATGLLAIVLLEGCYYYNFTTTEFNNNLTSRVWWTLTILCLYQGVKRHHLLSWGMAGVCLGLGMLSKYDMAVLAIVMAAFSLIHPAGRQCWKTPGPAMCLMAALAVFAPHVIWLVNNHFPTVNYFLQRSGSEHQWSSHLILPLKFAASQAGAVLPMLILAIPIIGFRWKFRAMESDEDRFNRDFLLWFACGPFILVEIVGVLLGVKIRSMWGTAMWSYAGVVLLFFLQLNLNRDTFRRTLYRSAVYAGLIALVFAGRNSVLPHVRGEASRIHFPGRQLALKVDALYRQATGESPAIIGGPWWEASNVAFYGDKPASVFANLDKSINPWMDDEELNRRGGVIVWTKFDGDDEYQHDIASRFPNVRFTAPLELDHQTSAQIAPTRFGVAIVVPETSSADTSAELLSHQVPMPSESVNESASVHESATPRMASAHATAMRGED